MKEPDCATFVNRDRETYRQTTTASRPTIDNLIATFTDKQTNMESDNKWNKLSMDQTYILSLIVKCENQMKNG